MKDTVRKVRTYKEDLPEYMVEFFEGNPYYEWHDDETGEYVLTEPVRCDI